MERNGQQDTTEMNKMEHNNVKRVVMDNLTVDEILLDEDEMKHIDTRSVFSQTNLPIDIYEKECKNTLQKVDPYLQQILQALNEDTRELKLNTLSSQNINALRMEELLRFISLISFEILSLEISDIFLFEDSLEILMEHFQKNKCFQSLKILKLRGIGIHPKNSSLLAESIIGLSELEFLDISYNDLTELDLQVILLKCKNLKDVNFSSCYSASTLSDGILMKSTKYCSSYLKHIDLSYNNIELASKKKLAENIQVKFELEGVQYIEN